MIRSVWFHIVFRWNGMMAQRALKTFHKFAVKLAEFRDDEGRQ